MISSLVAGGAMSCGVGSWDDTPYLRRGSRIWVILDFTGVLMFVLFVIVFEYILAWICNLRLSQSHLR